MTALRKQCLSNFRVRGVLPDNRRQMGKQMALSAYDHQN